uniref:Ymf98 n=1 Tax=Phytophthora agathidicida TaxID=1642459 RepID=A0A7U3QS50_9STRA|nr:ymf98 [Phytophthora agathidicida]QPN53799.1 ymf98 [Phytophthora agathidicida]QTV76617.1 ymf98 [Phytophthora agathidicida]QTV76773.1 ymf98 [Phytophthora agathidicida]DAD54853.1 TPA_asm: ymf98 [Phytophthora agathidicida]DAD54892.1 TPA_asm: ymf98 [Phytophthora agathidicida]
MQKKFFKKYKLNQLQKIKQTYKYIYIFRYNDLNINEIISLKKNIKKLEYKSLILNQKLTTNIFSKLKGQGSILLIYGNNDLNLIKNLTNFKKLELIYLNIQNNIYSSLKIKQILSTNYPPLNNLVVQPFLNFIYYLRKI